MLDAKTIPEMDSFHCHLNLFLKRELGEEFLLTIGSNKMNISTDGVLGLKLRF